MNLPVVLADRYFVPGYWHYRHSTRWQDEPSQVPRTVRQIRHLGSTRTPGEAQWVLPIGRE